MAGNLFSGIGIAEHLRCLNKDNNKDTPIALGPEKADPRGGYNR